MPKFLAAFCITMALLAYPARAQDSIVMVYAAASLRNAVDDVNAAFTIKTKSKAMASYAASSALAMSIEQGVKADVFASADPEWMDYVATRNLIKPETRTNLLGNKLVLIAPKDSRLDKVDIEPGFDLAKLAGDGIVATGDVDSVPVGMYAKAALKKLGSWAAAERKLSTTVNVRAALKMVADREAVLGIVYETDAKVEPNVKIIGYFPQDSYPPIIYPVALIATAKPEANSYFHFLRSSGAQVIFEKYGFNYLVKEGL